ncbi:helix-turn-helix transcriptional regulator [Arenibacterium arenosum]|uniref:Helix-turn-helix transcriptional regulator n=1 Tax=Sedimentitalea arenosa TaxID=2798803 RepID=A0A8J7IK22_9RHOB|nr:helix-turn-helix transcriptional regulator [Arenibacterium arenosum]
MAQNAKNLLTLDRVRTIVKVLSYSKLPKIAEVARETSTTSRTLQRRLAEARTSYREIVLSARHERAKALLSQTKVPVCEIAARLGYATPGVFSRVFAKRAKQSPRAWHLAAPRGRTQT